MILAELQDKIQNEHKSELILIVKVYLSIFTLHDLILYFSMF